MLCVLLAAVLARPHLTPARIHEPPVVDGSLEDAVWQEIAPSGELVQKFPDEGRPPSEGTWVRVAYDDEALYVAIDCRQEASPLVSRLTRRDHPVESDSVELDLDTRADGRSAFSFGVNAAGVLYDAVRFDDTDESTDWDGNWEAATARTPAGWSVELRIPLRVLRFPKSRAQEWGFQVRRHVSARQETDEWAYIPRTEAGEVSRYGTLGPFEGLAPRGRIEVSPFALGELLHRDALPGVPGARRSSRASIGGDARWHATQDLTVDATALPDFAQVEADEVVLNLSTYETFFPEKRPFFLEGIDQFATPAEVLYTRRIGAVADSPALPEGQSPTRDPAPVPIWSAVKVTCDAGGASTAILSAVTGGERTPARDGAGTATWHAADPVTAWQVVRLKRDLSPSATIGLIATAAVRDDSHARWTRAFDPVAGRFRTLCPDGSFVDPGSRCTHDAFVAGIDGRVRSAGGDYVLSGQLLGSRIAGGPPRLLPDGTAIRAGDSGLAGTLSFTKEGGEHLIFDAELEQDGRRYDPNDVGYLERQNVRHYALDVGWRETKPDRWTLERRTQVELFRRENLDGLDLGTGYQVNERGELPGFWSFFVELHDRTAYFDDREVGDGTALERAGLWGLETGLSSDPRKPVVVDLGTADRMRTNGWSHEADLGVTVNTLPRLGLGLSSSVAYTDGEPRFVGGAPGDLFFARQRAESASLTLRGAWTFSPRATVQAYGQIFAASSRFHDFSHDGGGGRLVRLRNLEPVAGRPVEPDFQEGALNANVVFRWEYRLGSTLYVVYSRSSSPQVDLAGRPAALDLTGASRGPATNAVQAKLTWWWG